VTSTSRQPKQHVAHSTNGQARNQTPKRSTLLLLGLIVIGLFVFSYLERLQDLAQVRAEIAALQDDIAQSEQRNAELEALRQQVSGADYVGETARAELGLILPGDDPFVVLGQESVPQTNNNPATEGSVSIPDSAQPTIFEAAWWRSLFGLR